MSFDKINLATCNAARGQQQYRKVYTATSKSGRNNNNFLLETIWNGGFWPAAEQYQSEVPSSACIS